MTENQCPLVSVVVITYNSAQYVLETLNSIKEQSYSNIELIISDDCSKDKTVEICRDWLAENKEKFVRTELITVEKNTGTSANINRGIKASKGKWIKSIAGDDCLLPNCISDNVSHVIKNEHVNILFSRVKPIGNVEEGRKWPFLNPEPFFSAFTPRQFRILLCERNFLPAPSVFMRKSVWEQLGGYNEDIPLLEDWPMWMKATQMGYKLSFMNKETAEYRFSDSSSSQVNLSSAYLESRKKCVMIGQQFFKSMSIGSKYLFFTLSHASRNKLYHFLHYLNFINPFYYEYMNANRMFCQLRGTQ